MVNRVAGCQPPERATPLLRFGLPSLPGVVGMVLAPGIASGKHPFYVVCGCGSGCHVCGGCGVGIGVWGCRPLVVLYACLVCWRRWSCVGGLRAWWVWHPPCALGVGLVLVLVVSVVAARHCCCGTLLCFAALCCAVCPLCPSIGSASLGGALLCAVLPWCAVVCGVCYAALPVCCVLACAALPSGHSRSTNEATKAATPKNAQSWHNSEQGREMC